MSDTAKTYQACLSCPPEKRRLRMTRGVCHNCYRLLHKKVRDGLETWAGLAEKGLCLPTAEEQGYRRGTFCLDPRRVQFGRRRRVDEDASGVL